MSYYYLIATLPDLSLEEDAAKIDYEDTIETIRRNLDRDDEPFFSYLLLHNDHRNLLGTLFHRYHELPKPLMVRPSVIDTEIVADYAHHIYEFPDHITNFLLKYQDRLREMSMAEIENQLYSSFYEMITTVDDDFIRTYFGFEKELKSIVAGINRSLYKFYPGQEPAADSSVSEKLSREGTGIHLLTKAYPFAEALREILMLGDPLQIEKMIDVIKWAQIDTIQQGFFSREQVFGYTLKLLMIQRWARLEGQHGKEAFRNLIQRIRSTPETLKPAAK